MKQTQIKQHFTREHTNPKNEDLILTSAQDKAPPTSALRDLRGLSVDSDDLLLMACDPPPQPQLPVPPPPPRGGDGAEPGLSQQPAAGKPARCFLLRLSALLLFSGSSRGLTCCRFLLHISSGSCVRACVGWWVGFSLLLLLLQWKMEDSFFIVKIDVSLVFFSRSWPNLKG